MSCTADKCQARRRMGTTKGSHALTPEAAAKVFLLNNGQSLAEASDQSPVALVFMRHFGCTFTRQLLRGLEELKATANRNGARLVLVHMLKAGSEQVHLEQHTSGVLRIADPKCELYQAFGLGHGGVMELFGPRVWLLGMAAIFKGCGVGKLAGNGLQMPGAFIYHKNHIIAAQRAKNAAEMPELEKLFASTNPESTELEITSA